MSPNSVSDGRCNSLFAAVASSLPSSRPLFIHCVPAFVVAGVRLPILYRLQSTQLLTQLQFGHAQPPANKLAPPAVVQRHARAGVAELAQQVEEPPEVRGAGEVGCINQNEGGGEPRSAS